MEVSTAALGNAAGRLRAVMAKWRDDTEFRRLVEARDEVVQRYGAVFSPENVNLLSEEVFRSFLLFENNRHWTGLHRQAKLLTQDMETTRKAIALLVDESLLLAERFDRAIGMVKGFGRALGTAILTVVYPEKYGVWNNTSEAALIRLELWPKFDHGMTIGQRYQAVNEIFLGLAQAVPTNLWTLDWLFWYLGQDADGGDGPPDGHRFALERHLQEFLWENWDRTELAKEWEKYAEPEDPERGFEYPTEVGRIDILARHKTRPEWLVIELKRDQSTDQTVGQLLRYIGWVKENLAGHGENVRGLIVARDVDSALRYAIAAIETDLVKVMSYEVDFKLRPVSVPPKSAGRQ